ncbi:MAG: hypothetical protein A2166_06830 [Omnitrophica WOR_2 bacterium RBG_13_41_10]|nr:MAG: hypothetical protein A2166_06830 [Omnitrophica WOR_2 bacterium RBG_13_41_10]
MEKSRSKSAKRKAQSAKQKMKKPVILLIFLLLIAQLPSAPVISRQLFAQDNKQLINLSKQIIEAKAQADLYPLFTELKGLYFQDNRYTDFVEFLRSLSTKKKTLEPFANYYIALSRYRQLKYLEDNQNWDEYFSWGNSYRQEIIDSAQKAIDDTSTKDPLNLYARLLLWQLHKDLEDAVHEQALLDLINAALEYTGQVKDYQPIKEVADNLFSQGEKSKAKELYKIYIAKSIDANLSDDKLKEMAFNFYRDNNLDLAQLVYDVYIERILKLPKETVIPILIDIAKSFCYQDKGPSDALYAENIFQKIEALGAKEAFNEELSYLRAWNLEKIKEYTCAKDIYLDLINRYPKNAHIDEVNFKVGLIYAYALADIKNAKSYFEKLKQQEIASSESISSFYQLGLFSQWEGDNAKAKEYYDKLIEIAKDGFQDTVILAKERLKEIEETRPIEYNLKTFMDLSLKEENKIYDMTKLELNSSLHKTNKDQAVSIASVAHTASTGCMQATLEYLWSGDLGVDTPSTNAGSFDTAYKYAGTKVINLVVMSPSGAIDRSFDIVDID